MNRFWHCFCLPFLVNCQSAIPIQQHHVHNEITASACLADLEAHFPWFMSKFGLMTQLPVELIKENDLETIEWRWAESARRAEACFESENLLYRIDLASGGSFGVCLPKDCNTPPDIYEATNAILNTLQDRIAHLCNGMCDILSIEPLGSWSQIKLNVAIVGYPRSGTTALLHHLVFHPNASKNGSASFDIPGVNMWAGDTNSHDHNGVKAYAREDRFFGYDFGWQAFPTTQQIREFNAINVDLQIFRNENNAHTSTTSGIVIKNPDYVLDYPIIRRLAMIPDIKLILQVSNAIRRFDWEIRRSAVYARQWAHKSDSGQVILCNETYDSDGQMVIESVDKCFPGLIEEVVDQLVTFPQEVISLTPFTENKIFLVHSDWFTQKPDSILRHLEKFLNTDEHSLGEWPEKPSSSKYRTNICTSSLYSEIQKGLEERYSNMVELFAERSLASPIEFAFGNTSCST